MLPGAKQGKNGQKDSPRNGLRYCWSRLLHDQEVLSLILLPLKYLSDVDLSITTETIGMPLITTMNLSSSQIYETIIFKSWVRT